MAGIRDALVDTGYYLGGVGTIMALSSVVAPSAGHALQSIPGVFGFYEYAAGCGLLSSAGLVIRKTYR